MDTNLQVTDVATTYFKGNLVRISATKECRGGGSIVQPFLTGGLAASELSASLFGRFIRWKSPRHQLNKRLG